MMPKKAHAMCKVSAKHTGKSTQAYDQWFIETRPEQPGNCENKQQEQNRRKLCFASLKHITGSKLVHYLQG
jgi:hypothetical protein